MTPDDDQEITQRHSFSPADANDRLSAAVSRTLGGDLAEVRRVVEALPPGHPRRRLLLSSLREVVAMLEDLPAILTLPGSR